VKDGTPQIRPSQAGSTEVGSLEIVASESCMTEVGISQIGTGEIGSEMLARIDVFLKVVCSRDSIGNDTSQVSLSEISLAENSPVELA
jgi:hypothetical protein